MGGHKTWSTGQEPALIVLKINGDIHLLGSGLKRTVNTVGFRQATALVPAAFLSTVDLVSPAAFVGWWVIIAGRVLCLLLLFVFQLGKPVCFFFLAASISRLITVCKACCNCCLVFFLLLLTALQYLFPFFQVVHHLVLFPSCLPAVVSCLFWSFSGALCLSYWCSVCYLCTKQPCVFINIRNLRLPLYWR